MMMAGLLLRAGASPQAGWFAWWPLLSAALGAGLALAKDIGFIVWSRGKLHGLLREQAAQSLDHPMSATPPPVTAPLAPPPSIAAP
jgi:hypothetical protein